MILFLNFIIQLVFLGSAFFLALLAYANWPITPAGFQISLLDFVIFMLIWLVFQPFYHPRFPKSLKLIFFTSFLLIAVFNLWSSVFGKILPVGFLSYLFLFVFLLLVISELNMLFIKSRLPFTEKILIIGGDNNARRFIKEAGKQVFKTSQIIGIIDNNIPKGQEVEGVPVLGKIVDLSEVAKEYKIDGLVQTGHFEQVVNFIMFSRANRINYKMIPFIAGVYSKNINAENKGDLVVLALKETPLSGFNLVIKRLADLIGAVVLTLLFSPILIIVAILLKIEDLRVPVFVAEERFDGYRNKAFKMFRFRTLPKGEKEDVAKYRYDEVTPHLAEIMNDRRATRLGKFLRKTRISEIPQFFNVILGQMSLIGPRPPYSWEVEQYEDSFKKRLIVKPGMTGLWQVSDKEKKGFKDMFNLDRFYVENWSPGLDISIFFKTIRKILRFKN